MSDPADRQAALLETFDNPAPQRDYEIEISCPEFTSLCPITGQPDFGEVIIRYVADAKCLELKSVKLYIHAFRQDGIFYEAVTNKILDDMVAACKPRRMSITTQWRPRGGISSNITAHYP